MNHESSKCELETDMPDSVLSLLSLQIGEKGKIVKISGGRGACKRLNELGLIPGTVIEVVNKISSGPVMIKVKGSKLALGRGLAAKVFLDK
jgi:ferrous iron transport protein A